MQFERRDVFYRERASYFYRPEAYSLTAFLVEIPYIGIVTLTFISISYWVVGLRPDAGSFFFMALGGYILAMFFMATAVAYSSLFPSLPVAQVGCVFHYRYRYQIMPSHLFL